jgi:hypothetical protein
MLFLSRFPAVFLPGPFFHPPSPAEAEKGGFDDMRRRRFILPVT